jgi:hypothetical protein
MPRNSPCAFPNKYRESTDSCCNPYVATDRLQMTDRMRSAAATSAAGAGRLTVSNLLRRFKSLLRGRKPVEVLARPNFAPPPALASAGGAILPLPTESSEDRKREGDRPTGDPITVAAESSVETMTPDSSEDDCVLKPDNVGQADADVPNDETQPDAEAAAPSNGSAAPLDQATKLRELLGNLTVGRVDRSTDAAGQFESIRSELRDLIGLVRREIGEAHDATDAALTDLKSRGVAHADSLVQIHEDLNLMHGTQIDSVQHVSELSRALADHTAAQGRLADAVEELRNRLATEHEAVLGHLMATRRILAAVIIIASVVVTIVTSLAVLVIA